MKKVLTTSDLRVFTAGSILFFLALSCKTEKTSHDATGTFEAVETIVSSEAGGMLKVFDINEGQDLSAEQPVGYVDSVQLHLKKKQLMAQIRSLNSRLPDIIVQTSYYKEQQEVTQTRLNYLIQEQKRLQRLTEANAATPKQLDDINAQVDEVKKQLSVISSQRAAQVSALNTQTAGLKSDVSPLYIQIEQLDDQIRKCRIINPVKGTVLTKYAEVNEVTTPGKALYKIADLSEMTLRAYVTGDQFAGLKLNQAVKVMTDDGKGGYKTYDGLITWISSKAEFTPKTIQTKDERANLVYAIKIRVRNDGQLKIGMYGEIRF